MVEEVCPSVLQRCLYTRYVYSLYVQQSRVQHQEQYLLLFFRTNFDLKFLHLFYRGILELLMEFIYPLYYYINMV